MTKKGVFVVHSWTPLPSRFTDGQTVRTADVSDRRARSKRRGTTWPPSGVDMQYVSIAADGVELYPINLRYAWPSELDLMAQLAGLGSARGYGGWHGEPFVSTSYDQVAVYRRA